MKIRDVPVPDQAVLVKLVNDSLFVATKSEMLVVNMKDWTSHNISLADNSTSKIDPVSINQMDKEVLLNYNSEFRFLFFVFVFVFSAFCFLFTHSFSHPSRRSSCLSNGEEITRHVVQMVCHPQRSW